jgi:tryptophan synthase beta chain
MLCVEAGGRGSELGEHAARLARMAPRRNGARPGVLHGTYTYLLQDRHGQISTTHSVSAGLDYPAVGPQHSFLHETGRVEYTAASDAEALEAARVLAQQEGIIPALEPAHALAELIKRVPGMGKDKIVVVNLSGRGDKDMDILSKHLG